MEFWRHAATRILREVDQAIVFAAPSMDFLVAHEETCRRVRNATYVAPVTLYDYWVTLALTRRHADLFYWEAIDGVDILRRSLFIRVGGDVSSVMDLEAAMLLSKPGDPHGVFHGTDTPRWHLPHGADLYPACHLGVPTIGPAPLDEISRRSKNP